jgi:hypothetical protein
MKYFNAGDVYNSAIAGHTATTLLNVHAAGNRTYQRNARLDQLTGGNAHYVMDVIALLTEGAKFTRTSETKSTTCRQ